MDIKWWAILKSLIFCFQFIERTRRQLRVKSRLSVSWIIPGDWGKAGSGWLTGILINRSASFGEAEFTSSSDGVRTPSNANEGLGGEE